MINKKKVLTYYSNDDDRVFEWDTKDRTNTRLRSAHFAWILHMYIKNIWLYKTNALIGALEVQLLIIHGCSYITIHNYIAHFHIMHVYTIYLSLFLTHTTSVRPSRQNCKCFLDLFVHTYSWGLLHGHLGALVQTKVHFLRSLGVFRG